MVNVYERGMDLDGSRGKIVARVKYNQDLDHWDGHNWSDGGTGTHLGITQLKKSKRFVLIHGTQWQGCRNYGCIVSDDEALQAILGNDPAELDNWPTLKALHDTKIETEEV